jgi:hypothetical protein
VSDQQTLTYQIAAVAVETGIAPQALAEASPEMLAAVFRVLHDRAEAVKNASRANSRRRAR